MPIGILPCDVKLVFPTLDNRAVAVLVINLLLSNVPVLVKKNHNKIISIGFVVAEPSLYFSAPVLRSGLHNFKYGNLHLRVL